MFSIWMILVFAYCIWVGRYFAKKNKGHWITFLFFPTAFMIVAFFALLTKSYTGCFVPYLVSLWSGCLVGLLITNPMPIKIDLVRRMIVAPGSWLLFFCLMVLCISKCAFDGLSVSMPAYVPQLTLISFAIKGAMTGLLYGQALSFWYRFSVADTVSVAELIRGRFVFFCGLKQLPRADAVNTVNTLNADKDIRCPSSAA